MDSDAAAYITAVQAADEATLPLFIRQAINALVVGLKADSNWAPIKAACLLAGPATLDGALVPLRGVAPTPFNFIAGDHDQINGLKGNGINKYLDSGASVTAGGTSNCHQSIWLSQKSTQEFNNMVMASDDAETRRYLLYFNAAIPEMRSFLGSGVATLLGSGTDAEGFKGQSRNNASNYTIRTNGANTLAAVAAGNAATLNTFVFARNIAGSTDAFSNSGINFYSIGEAVDLATMDSRLTTYMASLVAGPTGNMAMMRRRRTAAGGLL